MRIYKIATNKEAKISDLFRSDQKYVNFASQYVENYMRSRKKIPTTGEVVTAILNSPLDVSNIDHDFLKVIASSVINSVQNRIRG